MKSHDPGFMRKRLKDRAVLLGEGEVYGAGIPGGF